MTDDERQQLAERIAQYEDERGEFIRLHSSDQLAWQDFVAWRLAVAMEDTALWTQEGAAGEEGEPWQDEDPD